MAIACFYYPDPDVATSNGLEEAAMLTVTMNKEVLEQFQKVLETVPGR
jgi:Ca2+:H+ antiporter